MAGVLWLAMVQCVAATPDEFSEGKLGCGPHALALAARLCGSQITDEELEAAFGQSLSGPHSLEQLQAAAQSLGMVTRLVRVDPGSSQLAQFPMIAAIGQRDDDHFVVIYGRFGDSLQLLDYPNAPLFAPLGSTAQVWDGWGLYVGRSWRDFAGNVDQPRWAAGLLAFTAVCVAIVAACLSRCVTRARPK